MTRSRQRLTTLRISGEPVRAGIRTPSPPSGGSTRTPHHRPVLTGAGRSFLRWGAMPRHPGYRAGLDGLYAGSSDTRILCITEAKTARSRCETGGPQILPGSGTSLTGREISSGRRTFGDSLRPIMQVQVPGPSGLADGGGANPPACARAAAGPNVSGFRSMLRP